MLHSGLPRSQGKDGHRNPNHPTHPPKGTQINKQQQQNHTQPTTLARLEGTDTINIKLPVSRKINTNVQRNFLEFQPKTSAKSKEGGKGPEAALRGK